MLQQILLMQKQFLYTTSDEKQWQLNFIHNIYGFSINAGQAESNKMLISYPLQGTKCPSTTLH